MQCKTIKSFNAKGKPKFGFKVKHKLFSEAQKAADLFNVKNEILIKRVAYKCNVCGFYHVGTSTEMLENKPKDNVIKSKGKTTMKVVGFVNIDSIQEKEKNRVESIKIKKKEKILEIKKVKEEIKAIKKKSRLVGTLVIKENIWRFYIKIKVVKIITPEGKVKLPKIKNISPNGHAIPNRNHILDFINNNLLNSKL